MTRHLIIAGHGRLRSGGMDTGATGHIAKGEHRYMKENLFPAMKKYTKDSKDTFIFHTAYKVLDRGNLASLAKQHNADTVTEYHYDAFTANSSGGHVIVHEAFEPDALDLRLRDVIGEKIGLRFNHRGHQGISGRTNLGMINTARNNGINMRLVELGFGTNKREADIMVNDVDDYARQLVQAYDESNHKAKPNESAPAPKQSDTAKSIEKMAAEVEAGVHGNGHTNRINSLGVSQSVYNQVRDEVNRRAGVNNRRPTNTQTKSIAQMASEVEEGQHGNGHSTRQASLGIDLETYQKVRDEVNRRAGSGATGGTTSSNQSIEEMANKILNDPKAPNGHTARRNWLGVNDSTYQKVRARVNEKARGGGSNSQSIEQMANRIINDSNAPTGHSARQAWLGVDNATYQKVRARVNEKLS